MYEYFIGQLLGQLRNMKQNCSSLALLKSLSTSVTLHDHNIAWIAINSNKLSEKDGVESPSYRNDMKYYTIKSLKTYYSM